MERMIGARLPALTAEEQRPARLCVPRAHLRRLEPCTALPSLTPPNCTAWTLESGKTYTDIHHHPMRNSVFSLAGES